MVNVRVRHESEARERAVWFTQLHSIDQADALIEHIRESGGIFHAESGRMLTAISKRIVKDGRRCYVELVLHAEPRSRPGSKRKSRKVSRR